jgi:hypothetical protein
VIAALFVETDGIYYGLPDVDPWDTARDARTYRGPWPVVAHPPCQRWGRFWHGSTRKPHQFRKGEDGGCFAAALTAVRNYGGVLEHPKDSHAWEWFGLAKPPRSGGWVEADRWGFTCCVYQGHYGHFSGKPTWLYACAPKLPGLRWGPTEQRLHPVALARHGYAKARRIGMMAMVGGKDKTRVRNATPIAFRDCLLHLARLASEDRGKIEGRPRKKGEKMPFGGSKSRRQQAARKHAEREHECPICGRTVRGNGYYMHRKVSGTCGASL